jgi:hypothetical protein
MPRAVAGFLIYLTMRELEQVSADFLPIRSYSTSFRFIFSRGTETQIFLFFFFISTFSLPLLYMHFDPYDVLSASKKKKKKKN